jgi:hypothetical protein
MNYIQLSKELFEMTIGGKQKIDLVTHISNKLRMKKKEAQKISEVFHKAFHDGIDSILSNKDYPVDDAGYEGLYETAYSLSRQQTINEIRSKDGLL